MRPIPALVLAACLAGGCAQFPEVNSATDRAAAAAPYPELRPVEEVLTAPASRLDEGSESAIDTRAARLQRRADRLLARPVE